MPPPSLPPLLPPYPVQALRGFATLPAPPRAHGQSPRCAVRRCTTTPPAAARFAVLQPASLDAPRTPPAGPPGPAPAAARARTARLAQRRSRRSKQRGNGTRGRCGGRRQGCCSYGVPASLLDAAATTRAWTGTSHRDGCCLLMARGAHAVFFSGHAGLGRRGSRVVPRERVPPRGGPAHGARVVDAEALGVDRRGLAGAVHREDAGTAAEGDACRAEHDDGRGA